MPLHYRVDPDSRILVATGEGVLEESDLLAYTEQIAGDPEAQKARHELVDLRAADPGSPVSSDAVRRVAQFWAQREDSVKGGRVAFVAGSDLAFGLARMYELLRASQVHEIQVFRDWDEAWAWLHEA